MPKYFLVAKDGQQTSSSRAFSAADLRALKSAPSCYTFIGELTNSVKNVGACRRSRKAGMGGIFDIFKPKKKPAKRHPMSRTVYMMRTKSGSYIPVDRPPSASMAGARRKRKRR